MRTIVTPSAASSSSSTTPVAAVSCSLPAVPPAIRRASDVRRSRRSAGARPGSPGSEGSATLRVSARRLSGWLTTGENAHIRRVPIASPPAVAATLRRSGGDRQLARVAVEDRREPASGLVHRPALARGVVLELVEADASDAEVAGARVRQEDSRDRRAGMHREAVGQLDSGAGRRVEQLEQGALLGVVRLATVAGRGSDPAIALGDQLLARQRLLRWVGPALPSKPLVRA